MEFYLSIVNRALICVLTVTIFTLFWVNGVAGCEHYAEIESVIGQVEIQRHNGQEWVAALPDNLLCPGDGIRTAELSSTSLRLKDGVTVRIDQNARVVYSDPLRKERFWIRLLKGAALFFSQEPHRLRVDTPFVTAAIDGTEFLVSAELSRSIVTVYTGLVRVFNTYGGLILEKGESARAQKGQAPSRFIMVHPEDAVQWALFYPPVVDFRPGQFKTSIQPVIEQSLAYRQQGNILAAVNVLENVPPEDRGPYFYAYRAGLLLFAGRVDKALIDIEKIKESDLSLNLSLRCVIATAKNQKQNALELAEKAVDSNRESAMARSALAYAKQAIFDLKGALKAQKKALDLDPENALAWARLAELELMSGYLDAAENSAGNAVHLNPNLSRTHTVLGFSTLTQIKPQRAIQSFKTAVDLDPKDPWPRLGLGLARIRMGDINQGRRDIESAASLNPNNSLIRSYLGKAFYEQKSRELAQKQYEMAKQLDTNDPTPWLYSAIGKQADNRPGEALRDIQKSIELNDNRAVYRSRLLLDRDLASRSANLARIYAELGFEQLALVEGWRSLNFDPGNYSAHRFLADSYAALPRHEVARVSEHLQAQLLQPISVNPVQPQIAETNAFILQDALSSGAAYNEYTPLFLRDRLAYHANVIAGTNSTLFEEAIQSGLLSRFSYSLGQFHYETQGFRPNNDQDTNIYNAFFQTALSYKSSIMAEYRQKNDQWGDIALRFDPYEFDDSERHEESNRSLRVGGKYDFTPQSRIIATLVYRTIEVQGAISATDINDQNDGILGEIQYISTTDKSNLITGMGYFSEVIDTDVYLIDSDKKDLVDTKNETNDHTNIYIYTQFFLPNKINLTLGLCVDFLDRDSRDGDYYNPIVGLTWNPFTDTTFRAAAFSSVERSLVSAQTIQPTQVAGFNQLYKFLEGTELRQYGLALDQKFLDNFFGGLEFTTREGNSPVIYSIVEDFDWDETILRGYLCGLPLKWVSLSAEYFYERQTIDPDYKKKNVTNHRFPIKISFFHKSGISSRFIAVHVNHKNENNGSDRFWLFDAGLSYRLPKRLGAIAIEVRNLLNTTFNFQDLEETNIRLYPEQYVLGKLTLTF